MILSSLDLSVKILGSRNKFRFIELAIGTFSAWNIIFKDLFFGFPDRESAVFLSVRVFSFPLEVIKLLLMLTNSEFFLSLVKSRSMFFLRDTIEWLAVILLQWFAEVLLIDISEDLFVL